MMSADNQKVQEIGIKKRVAPVTYKERLMYQILKGMFGKVSFGIEDDLFELGITDEQIDAFVAEVAKQGVTITADDVRKYRSIEKIVRGTDRVCRWVNTYDPKKPVIVLVHGVTPESFFLPVLEGLKERFSILEIEPIVEHWLYAFKGERIQEVVDFYGDMVLYYLPENAKVYGYLGHSFGGDISYRLAVRWLDELGEHPYVYMIDTYMRVYDADRFEEYKEELLNRFDFKTRAEVNIFWKLSAYCLDVAKKLGDGKAMPPYDGPVRLFSATQVKEDPTLAQILPVKAVMREDNPNVAAWKSLASYFTVDFVDSDHITILQVPEFADRLFHRIDCDLGKAGSEETVSKE